jgi:hypothetical protein
MEAVIRRLTRARDDWAGRLPDNQGMPLSNAALAAMQGAERIYNGDIAVGAALCRHADTLVQTYLASTVCDIPSQNNK